MLSQLAVASVSLPYARQRFGLVLQWFELME